MAQCANLVFELGLILIFEAMVKGASGLSLLLTSVLISLMKETRQERLRSAIDPSLNLPIIISSF